MTRSMNRRHAARLLAAALATAGLLTTSLGARAHHDGDDEGPVASYRAGKIFTSSNAPTGNEVLVYQRSATGAATLLARASTNGTGTGAGLGSQGAVTLSGSGRFLFVVNAASNTLATFALSRSGLQLTSVVSSGGTQPISVAESDGLVYVLNAGGDGNVAGFRNDNGRLLALADGVRGLSAAGGTGPAQVGFSADGDTLVVSEKATSVLTSWRVRHDSTLAARAVTPSAGLTPFGFAVTRRGVLVVSEAQAGGALASSTSSYLLRGAPGAAPRLASGAVPTTQTAACWAAVTPDGRYAFVANAGSSSLSSYRIGHGGTLTLQAAQAGLTGANAGALDTAVTPDGRQLHVVAPRSHQIVSFTLAHDGSLAPLGATPGLPNGAAGLAVN